MPSETHRRWEYQVVPFPAEDTTAGVENLNGAGEDGWEAVGVIPRDFGESWVMLKRELLANEEPRGPVGFAR
jgi:hypothetical protein